MITIRHFQENDLPAMRQIWNEVVDEANAFPQEDELTIAKAEDFFSGQSYTGVAVNETGEVLGLYILHPNNVGRCGHIANASYAVSSKARGQHIGEALVKDCMKQAKTCGFRILQFNAVVASNVHARHLYERLGFTELGTIPGGFRLKDGTYEDIVVYYVLLFRD